MTTLNLQVAAGDDDAHDSLGGIAFDASDVLVHVINSEFSGDGHSGGFRFTGVTIPAGAVVSSAILSLKPTAGGYDIDCDVHANDVDDADDFSDEPVVSGRTLTTASVNWSDGSLGSGWEASPDLSPVIQEVIDRPGFADVIVVICRGKNTNERLANFESYESSPSLAAKLDIVFDLPLSPCAVTARVDMGCVLSADSAVIVRVDSRSQSAPILSAVSLVLSDVLTRGVSGQTLSGMMLAITAISVAESTSCLVAGVVQISASAPIRGLVAELLGGDGRIQSVQQATTISAAEGETDAFALTVMAVASPQTVLLVSSVSAIAHADTVISVLADVDGLVLLNTALVAVGQVITLASSSGDVRTITWSVVQTMTPIAGDGNLRASSWGALDVRAQSSAAGSVVTVVACQSLESAFASSNTIGHSDLNCSSELSAATSSINATAVAIIAQSPMLSSPEATGDVLGQLTATGDSRGASESTVTFSWSAVSQSQVFGSGILVGDLRVPMATASESIGAAFGVNTTQIVMLGQANATGSALANGSVAAESAGSTVIFGAIAGTIFLTGSASIAILESVAAVSDAKSGATVTQIVGVSAAAFGVNHTQLELSSILAVSGQTLGTGYSADEIVSASGFRSSITATATTAMSTALSGEWLARLGGHSFIVLADHASASVAIATSGVGTIVLAASGTITAASAFHANGRLIVDLALRSPVAVVAESIILGTSWMQTASFAQGFAQGPGAARFNAAMTGYLAASITGIDHTRLDLIATAAIGAQARADGALTSRPSVAVEVVGTLKVDAYTAGVMASAGLLSSMTIMDGAITSVVRTKSTISVSFHAFVGVTINTSGRVSINGNTAGTAISAAPLTSQTNLAGNPRGEVLLASSQSVASATTIFVYGHGVVILTERGVAGMTAFAIAAGRVTSSAIATSPLTADLDGPVQFTVALPINLAFVAHIEPPRIIGDLVDQFATFYVGATTATSYMPASKAVANSGRSTAASWLGGADRAFAYSLEGESHGEG